MKKAQIKIGRTYYAKVSNAVVPVRIDSVSKFGGWNATNEKTGRQVHIKTAARLRSETGPKGLRDLLSF
jgi:hypothetical protein